jgi:hypothetical protein
MKINKFVPIVLSRKVISIFVVMVVLISFGCRSKTIVKKLSTVDSKIETKKINGSLYHLPLTVVKVSVPLKLKKETPGKFSDFVPCFFDEDEVEKQIKVEKKEVSIDAPTFSSIGVADLSETFVVQTTGGYFETRTVSGKLTDDGRLVEGTIESKDETLPIAIKIAETAIGVGIKIGTAGFLEEDNVLVKINEEIATIANSDPKSNFEKSCYIRGFDQQIKKIKAEIARLKDEPNGLVVNADKIKKLESEETYWNKRRTDAIEVLRKLPDKLKPTIPTETDTVDDKKIKAENQRNLFIPFIINLNDAGKAKNQLDNLRKDRNNLQSDLANIDSEAYKARLKEIDDKIDAINKSFFGKTETFEWTGNFEFNPSKDSDKDRKTLFTYSKSGGICYNSPFNADFAKDGIKIAKEFQTKCEANDDLTKLQIQAYRKTSDGTFITQVKAARDLMKNETSGWYFRIPAKATVSLIECKNTGSDCEPFKCIEGKSCDLSKCNYDNPDCELNSEEYGQEKMMIAQFGTVVSLPAKNAGRSSSTSITLDETTGALKNFKVS